MRARALPQPQPRTLPSQYASTSSMNCATGMAFVPCCCCCASPSAAGSISSPMARGRAQAAALRRGQEDKGKRREEGASWEGAGWGEGGGARHTRSAARCRSRARLQSKDSQRSAARAQSANLLGSMAVGSQRVSGLVLTAPARVRAIRAWVRMRSTDGAKSRVFAQLEAILVLVSCQLCEEGLQFVPWPRGWFGDDHQRALRVRVRSRGKIARGTRCARLAPPRRRAGERASSSDEPRGGRVRQAHHHLQPGGAPRVQRACPCARAPCVRTFVPAPHRSVRARAWRQRGRAAGLAAADARARAR